MPPIRTACRAAPAIALIIAGGAIAGSAIAAEEVASRHVDFNRDVRPILTENCYACHGPDARQRKADLRLDTQDGALADLDGHAAVVPGKPDESELLARVTAESRRRRMPPEKTGRTLKPEDVEILRRWIAEGARWGEHWSFAPIDRPLLPAAAAGGGWARGPTDTFILARLEAESLEPAPEADRRALIRRLSMDLAGVPPTPEEVEELAADDSPLAYEQHADRLLASPRFGERLAAWWLDLVRYADTTGIHGDNHRDVSPYRDYVIESFNAGYPFDKFTLEQLAGDLVDGATIEQRVASGYNRLLMTTNEGGAQPKEYIAKYAADRVRNASSVWLGVTLGCAECHDHKYDPFATREFYGLAAFFADVREVEVGLPEPFLMPSPDEDARLKTLDDDLRRLRAELESVKKQPEAARSESEPALKKSVDGLAAQRERLVGEISKTLITNAIEPRLVRVLPRGNWLDDSGDVVLPGVPRALGELDVGKRRATRLDLARWLVEGPNPLVARVLANRLWKLAFGSGIVRTLEDFGSQGSPPTHPELLDWLAVELRTRGWDIKDALRAMVLSAAYRQSSDSSPALRQRDPSNQLLARQSRWRFDAELLRDNALAASGLLSLRIGGPSSRPYQPRGYWAHLNFPLREYEADSGDGLYRRSVYTYWCRTFLHPSLLAFDAPSREECTAERARSSTPQQALVLLNDPIYVEAARVLAARVLGDGASGASETIDAARLERAFQLVLQRAPAAEESEVLLGLLALHRGEYRADPEAARALLGAGAMPVPAGIDGPELAAWTSITRVLFNLHETMTRS